MNTRHTAPPSRAHSDQAEGTVRRDRLRKAKDADLMMLPITSAGLEQPQARGSPVVGVLGVPAQGGRRAGS